MGKRYSRSSTVWSPTRSRSAARRGPTPFRNCSGVSKKESGIRRLSLVRRLLPRSVCESRARDELQLAPFHVLLEHAKLRLLLDVQHLVNGFVRFLDVLRGLDLDVVELLEALLDLRVVASLLVQ